MKNVSIRILKLKVSRFFPKDAKVELSIVYSNETVKEILKTDKIAYAQSLAKRIVVEIRKTVKSAHQKFEEGATFSPAVNVYIEKEEEVTNKMAYFLEQLRQAIEKVRSMKVAEGYMDTVRNVTKMELRLE